MSEDNTGCSVFHIIIESICCVPNPYTCKVVHVYLMQVLKTPYFVFRLQAYERNENFSTGDPSIEDDFNMITPHSGDYKDLVAGEMVHVYVSKEIVDVYLAEQGVEFDQKHRKLYECHHIKRRKYALSDTSVFIQSSFTADMRKATSYLVNIKLERGMILETECECAAGTGPKAHCKHSNCASWTCHIEGNRECIIESDLRFKTSNIPSSYSGIYR